MRQAHSGPAVLGLVARVFAWHEELLTQLTTLMKNPAGRSEGATLQKSKQEKRAIAAALPVANALYLLHLEDEDDEQASEKAHALRRNKSAYSALPAALALAETRNVAQQAAPLKKLLADEAGIGQAALDELTAANEAFSKLLAAPKVAIEAGKNNRSAVSAALKAADKFVEDKLRPAVRTLGDEYRELREALLQAMRIDDAPGARGAGEEKPA